MLSDAIRALVSWLDLHPVAVVAVWLALIVLL